MGRVSQAQAAQNRERIVGTAARLFRERGIAGVSVADVMAEAGLTHGGFYKHFASKDALVAEAVALAFAQQAAHLTATAGPPDLTLPATSTSGAADVPVPPPADREEPADRESPADREEPADRESPAGREEPADRERPAGPERSAVVDAYLSAAHRDDPGNGCPTAGFGGDVARAAGGEATRQAYATGAENFARLLSSDDAPDLATLSTMVGALILSRATAGTAVSDQILAAARSALTPPPRH
jgi:TetR/AcrR family transcriptional repressor of nem operon